MLGDVKNLSVQLFLLRLRHEEKINKMGFPMNIKSSLALTFKNGYSIPKKKLDAMMNSKKTMEYPSNFMSSPEVDRDITGEVSESEAAFAVDGLNFCKPFPSKFNAFFNHKFLKFFL